MKIGTVVTFVRRNGQKATGRVAGTDQTDRGEWVAVNTAAKGKNPNITKKRPSQLKRV
jgi:hypothetical protein